MNEYLKLVSTVLKEGNYKENRTGVDTLSYFGYSYKIDAGNGYPLLTTKKMDGYRWDSMLHELIWYLSGEEHIRNLREETSIWDEWANDEGHLDTAYGRFWRRYPIPPSTRREEGEAWVNYDHPSHNERPTFDQIQYVLDELRDNPNSRRLVVNAWHPANAAESTLPPCHYTFTLNVQNNRLNLELSQRSGDIALGIPFNLACYTLLMRLIAQEVGLEVGQFKHNITDAHIYCGKGERGEFWRDNQEQLARRINDYYSRSTAATDWEQDVVEPFVSQAPPDPDNLDHVPNLLKQANRKPYQRPAIKLSNTSLDNLEYEDIELVDYQSHDGLDFGVAE